MASASVADLGVSVCSYMFSFVFALSSEISLRTLCFVSLGL
jgi:hypothetical protein